MTNHQPSSSSSSSSSTSPPPTPPYTVTLASPRDIPVIAKIFSSAFLTHDAIFPLIWGNTAFGAHEKSCASYLTSKMALQEVIAWKAIDTLTGHAAGFILFTGPRGSKLNSSVTGDATQPPPPSPPLPDGMNMELFNWKAAGPLQARLKELIDVERDSSLDLFFVSPTQQGHGIGSLLLRTALAYMPRVSSKIWLCSVPSATPLYQRFGWTVLLQSAMDLARYGGEGVYVRSLLLREGEEGG